MPCRASILSGLKRTDFQTQSPLPTVWGAHAYSDIKDLKQFKWTEKPRLSRGHWLHLPIHTLEKQ